MKRIKVERIAQFKSFLSGSEELFFQKFFPELLGKTVPVVTDIEVTDISNNVEEIAHQLSLQDDVQFFERRGDHWLPNDQIDQCQIALINDTHVADAARVSKLISWANI
jgi:hypothetical protein